MMTPSRLRRTVAVAVFFAACCLAAGAAERGRIRHVKDLAGKRLAVIAGSSQDIAADSALDFTQLIYYDNQDQELEALFRGEVDAVIEDEPVARYLERTDSRLRRVEGVLIEDKYAFATRPDDAALLAQINDALGAIAREGVLAGIEERWLGGQDETADLPPALPPEAPALRMGVSPRSPPFCYIRDDEITGLEIDLMRRAAARINRRLVLVEMEFGELIPSLLSGETDLVGSCFSITPVREKVVAFSVPFFNNGVTAVTLSDEYAARLEAEK